MGSLVIPAIYDSVGPFFDNGLASVSQGGKFGFIDRTGKVVIPLTYDYAYIFEGGKAVVELNGKVGVINTEGKVIIPFKYERVDVDSKNRHLILVKLHGKYGFVDNKGEIVIPLIYDSAISFGYPLIEGEPEVEIARVKQGGKIGFIDFNGNIKAPIEYEHFSDFVNGTLVVKKGGKFGLMDNSGALITPIAFDSIAGCARVSNVCAVEVEGRFGFMSF